MRIIPKFYSNLSDNNHCLQAALLSALSAIGINLSWDEINKLTKYEDGLYSWGSTAVAGLHNLVPKIVLYSETDHKEFSEKGEEYLSKQMGHEWFELQKKRASKNFQKEMENSRYLVKHNLVKQKITSLEEIENLLKENLLVALIDIGTMQGRESIAHFLLLFDEKDNNFIVHDPGLPPLERWSIDKKKFIEFFKGSLIIIPKDNSLVGREINRNDPCPCGAKKSDGTVIKYKHCHGR